MKNSFKRWEDISRISVWANVKMFSRVQQCVPWTISILVFDPQDTFALDLGSGTVFSLTIPVSLLAAGFLFGRQATTSPMTKTKTRKGSNFILGLLNREWEENSTVGFECALRDVSVHFESNEEMIELLIRKVWLPIIWHLSQNEATLKKLWICCDYLDIYEGRYQAKYE